MSKQQANQKETPSQDSKIKSQSSPEDFYNKEDFEQGYGFIGRLFLLNLLSVAVKIKKVLNKGLNVNSMHTPKLKENQLSQNNSEKFRQNLDKILLNGELKPLKVWKALLSVFKQKIYTIFFYQIFDVSLKLFNSVCLNFCIQGLLDKDNKTAYIWGAIMVISMLFSSLFRQNGWELGLNLNSEVRSVIINTTYNKVSQLSAISIKSANVGKIVNLISGDLNTTEAKFFYLFQMAIAPYTLAVACVILAFRLGFYGLLSIVFLIFIFPTQKFFGKRASKHTAKRILKTDERLKLTKEIIEGIQIIKMYGWEKAIQNIIEKIRNEEVREIFKVQTLQYIEKAISTSYVLVAATLTFIIINYEGSVELNSAKIFSTIEMLQYIKTNIFLFSGIGFGYIFELQIFLRRFIDIYSIKNIVTQTNQGKQSNDLIQNGIFASFNNFSAYFKEPKQAQVEPKNQITTNVVTAEQVQTEIDVAALKQQNEKVFPILKDLTFDIKQGEILGIVGKTGSGKSTLLYSFLKEIPYYLGQYQFRENDANGEKLKFAYVEQEPYIFSATIRENILFGKSFEEKWYHTVVQACCLDHDFQVIDKGDQTLVGERGANLSGGQKARISLARALYSNADVYLLDDPLSAVDSKVSKQLINKAICGLMKGKTVILVTHQIHFTKNCDRILILEDDGSLKVIGSFEEVFEQLKTLAAKQIKFENEEEKSIKSLEKTQIKEKNGSQNSLSSEEVNSDQEIEKKQKIKNKIEEKKDEIVNVSFNTYTKFLKIMNSQILGLPIIIVILFILAECLFTAFQRGLGLYDSTSDDEKSKLFGFLILFSCSYMITNGFKQVLFSYGIIKESKYLHNQMLYSMLRAPLLFFDKVSSGILINKFSNDVSLLDNFLHFTSNDSLDILCNFFNLLITCCVFNYYILIPSAIVIFLLYKFLLFNKDIILKMKQLDLANKSPVFAYFSSTLHGIIPIKVYGQNQNFLNNMTDLCNNNLRANLAYWLCSRFFGGFIQNIAIICTAIGVFIIISLPSSDPTLSAQSLTYFMLMADSVQWCLRQMLATDSAMSSVERIQNLIDQPSEAPLVTDHLKQQTNQLEVKWPQNGQIEFKNVKMRYRQELNPVLKGINFSIKHSEKVGCVGRTGAGKSSLIQALFRLTEPEAGSEMHINGIEIQKLGLHTLRQSISIIPQVPFVFGGTIRRNLDPLSQYTDEKLWEVLRLVELEQFAKQNCQDGLDTDMGASSCSFSVGQKQLICLARALLKTNKILVLDEATSNVDMETDQFIQKTLRTNFSDYTIITIAHRLNSIADYDKVIVMDNGLVAEYDSPFNLLANSTEDTYITKNTIFAQMVKHTGEKNSQNIFQTAKNKYINSQLNK
ncbi:ABC transporter C family protein (macronuclear) [Tetrahymena thermophila SB210]|uniref:ABC transporter C family protein n=1 Tax=Tetrahymena thermophila (strain SB210) TaxID=312017 RepID=I7MCU2_TETTS|nr:ABC transporter C family protein [Tetrahymena thermophila SB210]EAR84933.2 ABC transporter C family protein [Tetrahymena thermophila SB210]|eukprot:XP_001032596.2 ABC transporter C family protein [Tetrahymena thermophila SB210]